MWRAARSQMLTKNGSRPLRKEPVTVGYGDGGYVDAGGLMYYGADLADSYRRVA